MVTENTLMANGWTWDFTSSTIGFAYPLMSTMWTTDIRSSSLTRSPREPSSRDEGGASDASASEA